MSASLQVRPGDLYTSASRISVLPLGMQTPFASTEMRGGKAMWLWGKPFRTATAVPPFLPGWRSMRLTWQFLVVLKKGMVVQECFNCLVVHHVLGDYPGSVPSASELEVILATPFNCFCN
jgi:hypothetical protein